MAIIAIMRKYAVSIIGLIVMVAAFAMNVLMVDESVPNDANIGAGLLFMLGVGIVIAGLAMVWDRRSSAAPPPPKP